MTVGELKKELEKYPDDSSLVGQCYTPDGIWLNYPVDIGKAIGDNNLVVIQLKPSNQEGKK